MLVIVSMLALVNSMLVLALLALVLLRAGVSSSPSVCCGGHLSPISLIDSSSCHPVSSSSSNAPLELTRKELTRTQLQLDEPSTLLEPTRS